jgi:protoporphyrinogen/coproporphyrinogen III oxidase
MIRPPRTVVIGGGISGLTTAFWLHRWGHDVTVLERDGRPGGTMKTERDGDWLVETGPNSALETTPLFAEMFRLLDLEGEREYANEASNRRYILREGELHPLPMSPGSLLRSRLWSARGKLRILGEPFVGRGAGEETIAEFVERRLGREMLDYAINPFVAGVYAGDPAQLSVRAAFPKLYALEEKYGGLIAGMIRGARERAKRKEKAKDRARMFSFRSGMQTFPVAIAAMLGTHFRSGCSVESVEQGVGGQFLIRYRHQGSVQTERSDAVVIAVPASAAARLVGHLDGDLARRLEGIYYPPVAEVHFGFRTDQVSRPLDGFGFLIPAREGRKILGTIWSSAIFSGRAPAGYAAFTTFVGGSRQPEVLNADDAALRGIVLGELSALMGIRGEPAFERMIRWERAIPQYTIGYLEHYRSMDDLERRIPGLLLCGNYRGGIAVGDCIMSAESTARRVKEYHDATTAQREVTG